jgi:hypothetical protein
MAHSSRSGAAILTISSKVLPKSSTMRLTKKNNQVELLLSRQRFSFGQVIISIT